jgi:hypothetical protein
METLNSSGRRVPWNKGSRLTGQKPPLKLREIWAIRTRLQMSSNVRELALFNLAIDSKLRACDLTRLQVQDICMGGRVVSRATFMQQKTQRPVQFEITELTRQSVAAWISARESKTRRLSLSEPAPCLTACVDTPVRPHRPPLGRIDRTR